MSGHGRILELLQALLLAQEEFLDLLESAQESEGVGLTKGEIEELAVALLLRQPLDVREGLLQCSDGFGMGMPLGRLLGKAPQILQRSDRKSVV